VKAKLTARYITDSPPLEIRIQAFGIVQNYLADGSLADLYTGIAMLGEDHLLECIGSAARPDQPIRLRVAVSTREELD
jgi:hypothetical protein